MGCCPCPLFVLFRPPPAYNSAVSTSTLVPHPSANLGLPSLPQAPPAYNSAAFEPAPAYSEPEAAEPHYDLATPSAAAGSAPPPPPHQAFAAPGSSSA